MKKLLFTTYFCTLALLLLQAQTTPSLNNDGFEHQINYSGTYEDFIIPADAQQNRIEFFLNGGDGGKHSACDVRGGKGAKVRAVFQIGSTGARLRPGGTLRFIVGQKGGNRVGSTANGGGGGGGGTGILYKNPSASTTGIPYTNLASADTAWVILAVAGGGGGAFASKGGTFNNCNQTRSGSGGTETTSGSGGGSGNPGGTNGEGGIASTGNGVGDGGAGGGYLTDGQTSSGTTNNKFGKRGRIVGGAGGYFTDTNEARGGYGYGGGGAGNGTSDGGGGGGGGYSGGGGGNDGNGAAQNGGGGGSFVNSADVDAHRDIDGNNKTINPDHGFIRYTFRHEPNPIAVCQDLTVQLNNGSYTLYPEQVNAGSAVTPTEEMKLLFNRPGLIFPPSLNFNCSDIGMNNETLVVFVDGGPSENCTFTVNVLDMKVACAPADLMAQVGSGQPFNLSPEQIELSFDPPYCTNTYTKTVSPSSFTCDDLGINTVTLRVEDGNNNVVTCSATVVVGDLLITESINCPSNIITLSDPAACSKDLLNQFAPNLQSRCTSILSHEIDLAGQSSTISGVGEVTSQTFPVGTSTITYVLTASNNTIKSCDFTVTINDGTSPTALCQDITVQLDETGNASISAEQVDNGSNDNCNLASTIISTTAFDCTNTGENSVTLTVTDDQGNSSSCTALVTVKDVTDPIAICQPATVQLSSPSFTASQLDAGATDNCTSDPNLVFGLSAPNNGSPLNPTQTFSCQDIGIIPLTLDVFDVVFNRGSCTTTVTVVDDIPPVALCQDITLQLDETGNASVSAGQVDNGSNDNCNLASMMIAATAFDCTNTGENSVTLTVTDDQGNSSSCTALVTVEDITDPIAICQAATVQLSSPSFTASQLDAGSTDNCLRSDDLVFGLSVPNNGSPLNPTQTFSCADIGIIPLTLNVFDVVFNRGSCTTTVTVVDDIPPVALCQDITVQLDETGNASVSAEQVDNGSNDNCNLASMMISTPTFDCTTTGENSVTLTVTDDQGNSSSCNANILVEDLVPPTALCKDATVNLMHQSALVPLSKIDNGTSDACGISTLNIIGEQLDCDDLPGKTVTLRAFDNNGNVSSCTAHVTIQDIAAPYAECKNLTLALDESGMASISPSQVNDESEDNCTIASWMVEPNSFDCLSVGSNEVTLTVIDQSGNENSCTATVTIEDNIAPTALCKDATVTLSMLGPGTAEVLPSMIDNGTMDACGVSQLSVGGDILDCGDLVGKTVTLRVIDKNYNESTCTAHITVQDVTAPYADCQNITLSLDESGIADISPDQVNYESEDNCTIASMMVEPNSFDCSSLGANQVTLTLVDQSGNEASCMGTATVEGLPCEWNADENGIACVGGSSAAYDPETETWSLTSESCYSPYYYRPTDSHGYIGSMLCGDGELIARVANIDGAAFAGISMRESLDPSAKMIQMMVNNSGLARREIRTSTGGTAFAHLFQNQGKYWVKLTRTGNQFGAYLSLDGQQWDLIILVNIPMTNCLEVGLITMNELATGPATAYFDMVSLIEYGGGTALQGVDTPIASHMDLDQKELDFNLFPNPATEVVNLQLDRFIGQSVTLTLFNHLGQEIYLEKIDEVQTPQLRLDLHHYPNGIYFIQIRTKEQAVTKKLMLSRP